MDYMKIAQDVVRQAAATGAEAEAYINVGKQTTINVNQGQVEKLSVAGSKGIGVRVIRNGKMGYAYTSDFGEQSLADTVQAALTLAEVADGDEYRSLPEPRPVPDEDLHIFDPTVEATPTEEKVALLKAVDKAAREADPRVAVVLRPTYIDGTQDVYLVNSKGFSGSYQASFAASFTQAMAVDGEERAMGMGLGVGTSPADLDAEKIGRDAGERAVRLLGGRPVETQEATVVYAPFAAAGLLGVLSRALTAEAMQRNRSFLQGKMDQDVASDRVTLLDNGRLPGGLASRPFDDEGVPTRATRIINEGVLQAVLYDQYTANRDGTDSSGNASRGSHRGTPSLAPSNFYLQPGPETPEEVIGGVEKGLYVVNVMNINSINPISGEYSVSAQGIWIENGELTHPVNNVTIALPLDKLLFNVSAVANDLTFLPFFGAIGTPTFRVDGVMIGGT